MVRQSRHLVLMHCKLFHDGDLFHLFNILQKWTELWTRQAVLGQFVALKP